MKKILSSLKKRISQVLARKRSSEVKDEKIEDSEELIEITRKSEFKVPLSDDMPELPSEDIAESSIKTKEALEKTNPIFNEFNLPKQKNKFSKLLSEKGARFKKFIKLKIQSSPKFHGTKNKLTDYFKSIDFNNIYKNIFSYESRAMVHKLFIASAIVTSTYLTGKIIGKFFSPGQHKKTHARNYPVMEGPNYKSQMKRIASTDLFNAKGEEKVIITQKGSERPTVDHELVCERASRSSSLPIKLKSTIVLQDSVKSIASVQVRGGNKLMNIRKNDKINNMAQVGFIGRMKLVFKNLKTGQCEYIESSDKKAIKYPRIKIHSPKQGKKILAKSKLKSIKNEGNNFKIKKSLRDKMLTNIGEILTQARAIPIKNPDGSLAFKMTEVIPGSIYSQLNIENGDVITAINGKKIQSLNEVMTLFGKIRDIDQFEITLNRNGSEKNMEYNFE